MVNPHKPPTARHLEATFSVPVTAAAYTSRQIRRMEKRKAVEAAAKPKRPA